MGIMIGLGAPGLGIPIISLESNQIGTKWYAIEFSHIKGRIEIKVDDTIILGVDMNYIIGLAQESIGTLNPEDAATLMDILMKLLNTLKNSFKYMSLYKGT